MPFSPNSNGTEVRNNEIEYGISSALSGYFSSQPQKLLVLSNRCKKKKKIPFFQPHPFCGEEEKDSGGLRDNISTSMSKEQEKQELGTRE